MLALVAIGVALVAGLVYLIRVRSHRVSVKRLTRDEEEAAAAEHGRPLANVTVLRGGDAGDDRRDRSSW